MSGLQKNDCTRALLVLTRVWVREGLRSSAVARVPTAGLRRYTGTMKPLSALLLALACSLPMAAAAQWVWVDKDGRKVYSDRSPPPEVPVAKILKQPGVKGEASAAALAAAEPASAAKPAAASGPKISGKDKALEEKKKQADAVEAEKKKAQEAEIAAAKADNCTRAKRSKASFDSGVRIAQVNDKGEREVMDDKQREAEVKRLQALIARDCAPQ